jgi:hypothetical protein
MANLYRTIGTNVYAFMQRMNLTPEMVADKLSYSVKDIWNVIEGKVMLPPVEISKFASLLGVNEEDFVNTIPAQPVPNLEFMKEFSNPDNLDKILDLMDEYVELSETV